MTPMYLPPDHGTRHRTEVTRWAHRRHRPYNDQETAPNYSKWLGLIFSGLLKGLPPQIDGVPPEVLDRVNPEDLLDDAGSAAAVLGVIYLRPVKDVMGDWTLEIVDPTIVAPTWSHGQLEKATIWIESPDPRYTDPAAGRYLVLVERWDNTNGSVGVAVYEATRDQSDSHGRLKINDIDSPIEGVPAGLEAHPFMQDGARDTTPRRLIAVVHDWEDHRPAPLYSGNEGYMDGLERLDDQEQEDAELARHRIAMPEDMIGTRTIVGQDGHTVIASAGFNANDNLLALPPGLSAQQTAATIQPISFPDSLTQRERIEARQNTLLELCGISPSSIGRNVTGRTDSGAAKRADQQLTAQTIASPGRRWSRALTLAYNELVRLSGSRDVETDTPADDDGPDRTTVATVRVRPGLRLSVEESASAAAEMAASESASTKTRVATLHPDWTEQQVAGEVALIDREVPSDPPLFE